MTTQARAVTAEEPLRMPDDGTRRELVRRELRERTPAGDEHGYLALRIASRLERHVDANKLGRAYTAETGFRISSDPDTVRAPDAAFVGRERVEAAGQITGYRSGAPDLAVEVVSHHDGHSEVLDRAPDWLEAGCRMALVADPARRAITVYRSREDIRVPTAEAGDAVDGAEIFAQ